MTSDQCWVKTYTSIPCGSSYLFFFLYQCLSTF